MKLYFLIALATLAGACVQKPQKSNQLNVDIAAINDLREKERKAAVAGNVDALMALRTDDFIAMLPGMPAVKGKEALREVLTGMFGQMEEFEHETRSEEVIVSGDWAFHRGTFTDKVTLKSGGEPIAYEGKYLWILQRQEDESWKYAVQMSNRNGPAAD